MKQKIIIKVSMHCSICRTKAMKIAAVADGVISVALHGPEKDKLLIEGDGVDAACLTSCLRRKLCHASIEMVEEVKKDSKSPTPKPKPPPDPCPCPCPCPQPQFGYITVVTYPPPGTCGIM